MAKMRGVFRNGVVEFIEPPTDDLFEGEEVVVETGGGPENQSEIPQLDDPESLARWEEWLDSLEPFLSPDDEARWEAALAEQKRWEIENAEAHNREAADLFR
jgi:hypothetical protein